MVAGAAYRDALKRAPENAGLFSIRIQSQKKTPDEIAVTVFARIISFCAVRG